MTPSSRLAASLLASLVLGWPALEACLAQEMPLDLVLVRWAGGFFVAWIALGLVGRLVTTYKAEAEAARSEGGVASDATLDDDGAQQRRLDDGPLSAS